MTRYFHFTVGPVQGFVAQARRTRDFWAGSFILSYLSAVAMKAVQEEGGEILFPAADEAFLRCLTDPSEDRSPLPTQGAVPNRFKAKVRDGFRPERIADTLRAGWRSLADVVWHGDLAKIVEDGPFADTAEIWRRQVDGLWEIVWALTAEPGASDVLDRRKCWRSHLPPAEPGIKCSVMDGWQELSGAERPGDPKLTSFWRAVREKLPGYDLADGEHLCAPAFVKRRFAQYFERVAAVMPGGWTLRGWRVPTAVPSVAYLAAAPWLAKVIAAGPERSLLDRFEGAARELAHGYGEWRTDLQCLVEAEKIRGETAHRFRSLDGGLFFESNLDNPRTYPDRAKAEKVRSSLLDLYRAFEIRPSPFYAVLMMDGDSLGHHMGDVAKQPAISRALEEFTGAVQTIVRRRSGFLIYSGGDDVLALLPLDQALGCALDLRCRYLSCFETTEVRSTLSGAIVYAHYKVPLTRVLGESHELLDDVAKDRRGRDALAVRVWVPGSRILEWSMPWQKAVEPAPGEADDEPRVTIETLAAELAGGPDEETFAGAFFFRLRELFELINPRPDEPDDPRLSPDEAVDLMTAEYVVSGIHGDPRPKAEDVRPRVRRLLEQCRPVTRVQPPGSDAPPSWRDSPRLRPDGGLLARFLAHKGIEP